ncbi:MAG: PDZ domain-containing protein [Planctomycetes bacterium]|nr:PDZ domain-containing protein [Planctomycetota bacterium]
MPLRRPTRALWLLALGLAPLIGQEEIVPALSDLAPTIGKHLERDYYDHQRFIPKLMVSRALRALETAEVSIDTRWKGGVITLTVAEKDIAINAMDPTTLDQAMALIEKVRVAVDGTTLPPVRRRDLAYVLVNGALRVLDPHTVVMPPEPAKDFREDIAGEFFGIGAFLQQEEGTIGIERVMAGLPADKAGVMDGDNIIAINGEKTAGLSLSQAVRRIKGPKGTTVVLTVERKSAAEPLDISVVRDLVQMVTMRGHRRGEVGYIRMDEFNGHTARDLFNTVLELQKEGPLKAFVLDLRFNGGGLLDQARLVSDFFLPKGDEIVRTVTSDGEPQIFRASARQILDVPMVVMTSGGSASAAEILSGALQRNERAVVIGATTFGKGSVQTIKDLSDGSRFKLTIQEYQLPGGVSIQDLGVNPDVKLVRHAVREDGAVDLIPFSGSREVDDEFALKNKVAYEHPATYELGWVTEFQSLDDLKKSGIAAREFIPDQEATLVLDLVSEAAGSDGFAAAAEAAAKQRELRAFMLNRLKQPVAKAGEQESQALANAFSKRTPLFAWGAGTVPEAGSLTLAFKGPDTVIAGATTPLTFTVTNGASTPIGRLYGMVDADRFSPLWEDEVVFGQVDSKGSVEGVLKFSVPPRAYAGEERFTLNLLSDHGGVVHTSVPVTLTVQAQPRPHLSYTWELVEPGGNGQLDTDEQAAINLTVINDGQGPSSRLDLRVFKDNDPFVQLGDKGGKIEPLQPGGKAAITVPLSVLKEAKQGDKTEIFSAKAIKLQVRIEERFDEQVDARFRASLFHSLSIPVGAKPEAKPVIQPSLSLIDSKREGNQVTLTVQVADDNLRFLTTFLNEDKVDLLPAARLAKDGKYQVTMTLTPGANAIRIVAFDNDEMDEVLPVRLWGDGVVESKQVIAKPVVVPKVPPANAPAIP